MESAIRMAEGMWLEEARRHRADRAPRFSYGRAFDPIALRRATMRSKWREELEAAARVFLVFRRAVRDPLFDG